MKKMYFLTIAIIITITAGFLLFSTDTDNLNKQFLSAYGLETDDEPQDVSQLKIPEIFDNIYEEYNLLQIEAGLDLSPHKGKTATRYTYYLENVPNDFPDNILVNVICIDRRPVAGDIICPALDGFIKPLNFFMEYQSNDITQYHIPATKELTTP